MAYNEILAKRIRALIVDQPGLTEQKMFGGLAFLVNGHMAIAASSRGGLMVRIDPSDSDMLIASTQATSMKMRGRIMPGWLYVNADNTQSDADLAKWIGLGTTYAASLPPK